MGHGDIMVSIANALSARLFACLVVALAWGPASAAPPVASAADYRAGGRAELERRLAERPREGRARNVILFIGDGMGVSTLTAARILQGQRAGVDGESHVTAMDRLPHAALVRTYSHDAQVADSAPTATAILSGVKANAGVVGMGPEAANGDCLSGRDAAAPSLFVRAQAEGRATGVVSTARITHATPAATYAHSADRDWEDDSTLTDEARANGCVDIARQLIEGPVGRSLDVVLGGGRAFLLPRTAADPEYPDRSGRRTDGRDLTAEWRAGRPGALYVWNREGFQAAARRPGVPLLGLFEPDHMRFEGDRANDPGGEPSLAEMTRAAIARLAGRREGYLLLVEGGRIDHAHHDGRARRALEETVALDEAVAAALEMVDLDETLVLVTSDHSHTLTMGGYPARGSDIVGLARDAAGTPGLAGDGKPFTTLGYANGPGAREEARADLTAVDVTDPGYRQQAAIPMGGETHGGEDVAARAAGARAHLVRGTIEQHGLYYLIEHAMGGAR